MEAAGRHIKGLKRRKVKLPIAAVLSVSGPHGLVESLFQWSSPYQAVLSTDRPPLSSTEVLVRFSIRGAQEGTRSQLSLSDFFPWNFSPKPSDAEMEKELQPIDTSVGALKKKKNTLSGF